VGWIGRRPRNGPGDERGYHRRAGLILNLQTGRAIAYYSLAFRVSGHEGQWYRAPSGGKTL
jgi:hypothetical protein